MSQGIMLQRSNKRRKSAHFVTFAALGVAIVGLSVSPGMAQERASVNRTSEGLYAEQGGPLRGDRVDLDNRYRAFAYATKDSEGNVHVDCLDEHPHVSSQEEASE